MISYLRSTYNWCVFMYNLPSYLEQVIYYLYVYQYQKSLELGVDDEGVDEAGVDEAVVDEGVDEAGVEAVE